MLPFLKSRKVPILRKQVGESRYGFSEDDEIKEHSMNELMEAVDSKDHKKLIQAIMALVDCIMASQPEDSHAANS